MRVLARIVGCVALVLLVSDPAHPADNPLTYFLDHADSVRVRRESGRDVYFGYGHVNFRLDSARVLEHADSVRIVRDQQGDVAYAYGDVRIRMDTADVRADSIVWRRSADILECYGQVEVYDSIQHLWADQVSYQRRDSQLVAQGGVVSIQGNDSIRTESDRATYDLRQRITRLDGEPRLYLNYPDLDRLVTVTARQMQFYSSRKIGIATREVVIVHQDMRATCDSAQFDLSRNLLTLMGNPHAVRGASDLRGQEMTIQFSGGAIKEIAVFGDAEAWYVEERDSASGELSGKSKLTGKSIIFYLADDQVRKIAALSAARSEYYPPLDDTTGAGKNFTSGDSIFIYISDRKTNKVEIKGGAEGVYVTKNKAADSAKVDSLTTAGDSVKLPDLRTVEKPEERDSAAMPPARSSFADSTVIDSTAARAPNEDSINYRGNYLEFFVSDRIIRMTGSGVVRQGDVVLTADRIDYDVPKRVVVAAARTDTVGDTTVVRPLSLKDGSEEIFGSRLVFNVDTKRGRIEDATTKYEQSYYTGRDLFKAEEKIFFVENGTLSSCELTEPHYHFQSKRMKLIHNDKVIARPVTLYIETLPVMIIPYYVFPLKRGRHSGILPIRFGNFERGSRFVGNLGYYWAASDFWDLQGALDFYENTGTTINGLFRYRKLYAYSGQLQGSFARERRELAFDESRSRRWTITGSHSQTLPYDISFQASGTFVSDKNFYTDYSTDPNERLNRSINSKANFNKRFGQASLSLSFNHTNNLDANSRTSQLPSGGLTVPSFHPFGSGREVDGKTVKKWYNEFYVGYRNGFGLFSDRRTDTAGARTRKEYAFIDHSLSLTAAQKLAGYFNVGPNLSFTETWYYVMNTDQSRQAGIKADTYRRGAVSGGVGINTNLYGTFPIGLFGMQALRHVLTPAVGFNWAPPIRTNEAVRQYVGRGGGSERQMALSASITQLFQAKVGKGEGAKKLDLLRVSSGTGYNFEAKGRKLSDLNTSVSTSLGQINLSGSVVHDLYDKNEKINWRHPRLNRFEIGTTLQARGSVGDDYVRRGLDTDTKGDTLAGLTPSGLDYDVTQGPSGTATSWNLSLSHRYSESGHLTGVIQRTHWIQLTVSLDLTVNWKVKYHQNYDFVAHQSTERVIDLVRRLHCWEGHFYWIPDGSRKGYYFKINVLAIPDIKLEKSESGLRGALFNR